MNNFINIDFIEDYTYTNNSDDLNIINKHIQDIFSKLLDSNLNDYLIKPLDSIIKYALIQDNPVIKDYHVEFDLFTPTHRIKKLPFLVMSNQPLSSFAPNKYSIDASYFFKYTKDKDLYKGSITFKINELTIQKYSHLSIYFTNEYTFEIKSITLNTFEGFSKYNLITLL